MLLNGYPAPKPVPPMQPQQIADHISYVQPLSRRGTGPGIVLLVPQDASQIPGDIENGIPSVRMKWAEEGYCVVEIRPDAWKDGKTDPLVAAIEAFASQTECEPKEKLGLVCYDAQQWPLATQALTTLQSRMRSAQFAGAILYSDSTAHDSSATQASIPTLTHLTSPPNSNGNGNGGGVQATRDADRTVHLYPTLTNPQFALPFHKDFHYASESVAHSRDLAFLKPRMGGPYFDLEAVWDEHTYYEFGDRSVDKVMATMVQEPYVNHIPTITGGIGRAELTAFYRDNFIYSNPDDSELELISRTVGIDRIVDEFVFKATFDKPIHWLFPGVPPTGNPIAVPMTVVVNVRGDRLYHEHINWDSATALRQIGLLGRTAEVTLPAAAAAATNGHKSNGGAKEEGRRVEVQLPVAEGFDAVEKMRNKNSVQSNQMLTNQVRDI